MEIRFYTNKRNENKHLEVHHSDCGHYTVCQFMQWGDVTNWNGNKGNKRRLIRWKKGELDELLKDYVDVTSRTLTCECSYCGRIGNYVLSEEEYNNYLMYYCYGQLLGFIQDLFPNVPAWIRSGAIDKRSGGFCICPKCF